MNGFASVFKALRGRQCTNEGSHAVDVAQTPTEGKYFEVNLQKIDRRLFEGTVKDKSQKEVLELILEAFAEADKHPEKYPSLFYTMIPKKTWNGRKSVWDLKLYAKECGGKMGDWVHQALEWAQRISNGESWTTLCKEEDPAEWYRLIMWKDRYARRVGCWNGGYHIFRKLPATNIYPEPIETARHMQGTVPLVVFEKM